MIVVYSKTCAPCKYRVELIHIKKFARSIGAEVKIVETLSRADLEKEAKLLSEIDMPFVYNTNTRSSMALTEVSKGFTI